MSKQLQDKVAIVGASNGISRGIAEMFAAEGAIAGERPSSLSISAREAEPSGTANPGRALGRAAGDFLFDLIDGGGAS
jgi:NAD(P)-dependent dehydrogenase (short-subunit alcohol dehydrogenase family)